MIDTKLITFITVAKTKNLTRAAELLNLTQPAVSQHIKALEEYYEVKLLLKQPKQMALTEEGEILYKRAIELNRISKKLKNELGNKSKISKRYDVGATLTIGGYVLPELIGRYREIHENREIILYVENTEKIMKKLFDGDICLGVVEGPFDKTKVKYRKMRNDELVLAVSEKHPFASRDAVSIEEVLESNLILREEGSGTRKVFENKLGEEGYALDKIYMEIGDITAVISLVESNLGCTVISKEALGSSLLSKKIKVVPIEGFKIMREFNFVYLDESCEAFVDDFCEFCMEE